MLKGGHLNGRRNHNSLPDSCTKASVVFFVLLCLGGRLALETLHCNTIICLSEHATLPLITLLPLAVVNLLLGKQSVQLTLRLATCIGFRIHIFF